MFLKGLVLFLYLQSVLSFKFQIEDQVKLSSEIQNVLSLIPKDMPVLFWSIEKGNLTEKIVDIMNEQNIVSTILSDMKSIQHSRFDLVIFLISFKDEVSADTLLIKLC